MSKRYLKSLVSLLVVFNMLLGIFPVHSFAKNTDNDYDWQGKWIWTSDKLPSASQKEGQWVDLRKTFTLNEIPEKAEARISVDSRYWLWINGEMAVYEGQLKMGPDVHSWYYDTVDLTPYLKKGENTIAVLACYWGYSSGSTTPTGDQGFLFDAVFSKGALANGATRLISDESWKVIKDPGYVAPPYRENKRPDAVDSKFNAATAIEGWKEPGFDDSAWANATVKTLKATDPRNTLAERSIPQWKVGDIVKYSKDELSVTPLGGVEVEPLSLPSKYTVTAEVKSIKGSIGIAVCMNDNGKQYYMPQLQSINGAIQVKPHLYNSSWSYPTLTDGASLTASMNQKFTVKIEVDGNTVTAYAGGTKLGSFTDTTLSSAGNSVGFRATASEQTAVYSMKITDADGKLIWQDNISAAKVGDKATCFKKLSGATEPTIAKDNNGATYALVNNCVVTVGKQEISADSDNVYSFYNRTNIQGTPYLKVRSAKGGETIHVTSDVTAHPGGETITHYYVTKAGEQEWEAYGWMSGWKIDFAIPAGVEVIELGWRESSYATEHTGSVVTSDERLNQLLREAYDTLLVTMRDTYMDCPDRERTQWWGDAVLEMQQAAYAMNDDARLLYKKLLTQVIGWTEGRFGSLSVVPTNSHMELHAQSMAGVHSLWQYYLYYGETDILELCYEPFLKFLKFWKVSDTGYVSHREGTSDWIDWGINTDASICDHAWYYLAAESLLNVAKLLGKSEEDIAFLERNMTLIEESFDVMFWNESQNAYYCTTANGKPDDRANALAVYSGLADPSHYPKILQVLQKTKNSSPYMEKYVLEAMYMMGYAEEAIERTLDRYGIMLTDSFPTLYEYFNASSLSTNGGTGTRNHGWSGGPLSLVYMYSAGIKSTSAAFKTITVRPMLGGLSSVSASTERACGVISVDLTPNSLSVSVPDGCSSALICVPRLADGSTSIKLGGKVLYSGGKVASSMPDGVTYSGEDADYVCFTVGSGKHNFTMTKDAASAGAPTVTITSEGNGAVRVNGVEVKTPYTFSASDEITLALMPENGNRIAYVTGGYSENIYSNRPVSKIFTPESDFTVNVVFEEQSDKKVTLKINDDTPTSTADVAPTGMFYAFRLYVNGEEVQLKQFYREEMLALPYFVTVDKGERVTVSVEPVSSVNYAVYLRDAKGNYSKELTLDVNADTELSIVVMENPSLQKLKIEKVTANSSVSSSSVWKPEFLIDGKRMGSFHTVSGYSSEKFYSDTPDSPVVITLDLGSAQIFNQVSLFPINSYMTLSNEAPVFPTDFTIEVSSDGTTYQTVVTETDYENPYVQQQVFRFDDVIGRYVRLTVTKVAGASNVENERMVCFTEIEVAQTPVTPYEPIEIKNTDTDTETDVSTTDTPVSDSETLIDNGGNSGKGCGSVITGGAAACLLSAAAALLLGKKKKDN